MPTRCIYCLEEKDDTEFNREHVVPQSFGRFDCDNLVLTCVCKECNSYFGRELDEKLARDTIEGIDRVRAGLKPARKFKTRGPRSTTYVEIKEGPLRGVLGHHVPAPDGKRLAVSPLPCIGFGHTEDADFVYFPPDDLPRKEELGETLGFKKGDALCIRMWGIPIPDGVAALEAKGYPRYTDVIEVPPPSGTAMMATVGIIAGPEFRAMAKVALNYLAAVTSPGIAGMPAFNEVRRFARYDVAPAERVVSVMKNPWTVERGGGQRARGHYVSLSMIGDAVVAQVSLLLWVRYVVVLARGGFALSLPQVFSAGHFFDTDTRRVMSMAPLPLAPPPGSNPEFTVTLKIPTPREPRR